MNRRARFRPSSAVRAVLAALLALPACNAILGVEEGRLVPGSADAGSGGSPSGGGATGAAGHTTGGVTSSAGGGGGAGGGAAGGSVGGVTGAGGSANGGGPPGSGGGGGVVGGGQAGGGGVVGSAGTAGQGGNGQGGTGGTGPGVTECGGKECRAAAGETCCFSPATSTYSCVPPGASCGAGSASIACDQGADCATGKCQAVGTQASPPTTTGYSCQCDPAASTCTLVECAAAEACPAGTTCCLIGGLGQCKQSCGPGTTPGGTPFCTTDADCAATAMRCLPVTSGTGMMPIGGRLCQAGQPPPVAAVVRCGATDCKTGQGEHCCYDLAAGKDSCGTTTCPASNVEKTCDGPEDCSGGLKCCLSRGVSGQISGTSCGTDCTSFGSDGTLGCTGPHNCPGAAHSCCATGSSTACGGACTGATATLCDVGADCGAGLSCLVETSQAPGTPTSLQVCKP